MYRVWMMDRDRGRVLSMGVPALILRETGTALADTEKILAHSERGLRQDRPAEAQTGGIWAD